MSQTYDPIMNVTELRRPRAPLRSPAMGTTLVIERPVGAPLVVRHGERVPEPRLGNYRRLYVIDTGIHGVSFTTEVKSADPAFPFTVTFDFACQINDPVIVVTNNVRNMTAALSPSLTAIARRISVRFDVLDPASAEGAIIAELNTARRDPSVLLSNFAVTVEAMDVAEIVTARRKNRVLEMNREAMRPVANGGRNEMLAHVMAMDGGDPAALLDREQEEREANTQASLAALGMLMDSDANMENFNRAQIAEGAVTRFFPTGNPSVSKRTGVSERLERKRRNQIEAGGPVIEEGASASEDSASNSGERSANGRRSGRVRGKAWSTDD